LNRKRQNSNLNGDVNSQEALKQRKHKEMDVKQVLCLSNKGRWREKLWTWKFNTRMGVL